MAWSQSGATVATAFNVARRVSATSSSRFSTRIAARTCVESVRCCPRALSRPSARQQAVPEFAQDRKVEPWIRQVETQQILPVDARADCLSRLAIGEVLAELHDRHQRQPP